MSHQEVQLVVDTAIREAILRRHEYITVEHLLYSILQHEQGTNIILYCDGDVSQLLSELTHFFEKKVPEFPVKRNTSARGKAENEQQDVEISPVQTLGFRRVLERAMTQVSHSGKNELEIGDLLASMFLEQDSFAAYILKKHGIDRLEILDYISHGVSNRDDEFQETDFDDSAEITENREKTFPQKKQPKTGFKLELFAINLTELARQGKLDPLIGRETEMQRITQVLCRRLKHNPILIGEPGVGKTAIVGGLAQKIVKNDVPEFLENSEIFSLDLGAIVAGTKFRGQFEQRLKTALDKISKYNKKSEKGMGAILFIDEIHMVVGAGAASGTTVDASGLIKKALHTENLRCIGTTTHEEYRRHFEQDRALVRRFQKINISEASVNDTIKILKGLRNHFEDYYDIHYTNEALKSAVNLSFKHIAERFLPDKAIDIIDEAGALNEIRKQKLKKDIIDIHDVEEVVSQISNVPDLNPAETERDQLSVLDDKLKKKVFGQDRALSAVSASIKLSRAGLNLPDKPVGAFLFAGPTGVGKTEVAKQLAAVLGVTFKRFDMSEYMEKHAVSRLIGAPPGYVGYDQGGLLTETIRKNPHSVLLLDEIEKAHADLFDILLQVMDHATLTDNTGREADFRNVIIIMTTNAGAREMEQRTIGFDQKVNVSASKKAVEKLFSPEFRNRLTETVFFNPLSLDIMEKIVKKFIDELNLQLKEQKIKVKINKRARTWLAQKGFDDMYGARPLARLIQKTIRQPLAEEILFGKIEEGSVVEFVIKNDELVIKA